MATIDDDLAAVTAEDTAVGSVLALLTQLQAQVAAALSTTNIAPADQAKLDAVFTQSNASAAAIAAALAANVPPAPPAPAARR
jgi:hypothetical protein